MAESVIDGLEAVKINHHQRHHVLVTPCLDQRLSQAVLQQAAVGQLGKRVVVGQKFRARLVAPQLGDVGAHRHYPTLGGTPVARMYPSPVNKLLHKIPVRLAVAANTLDHPGLDIATILGRNRFTARNGVTHQLLKRHALRLTTADTKPDALQIAQIALHQPVLAVENCKRIGNALDRVNENGVGARQPLFRLPPLGHIRKNPHRTARHIALLQGTAGVAAPDRGTVTAGKLHFLIMQPVPEQVGLDAPERLMPDLV